MYNECYAERIVNKQKINTMTKIVIHRPLLIDNVFRQSIVSLLRSTTIDGGIFHTPVKTSRCDFLSINSLTEVNKQRCLLPKCKNYALRFLRRFFFYHKHHSRALTQGICPCLLLTCMYIEYVYNMYIFLHTLSFIKILD